MRAWTLILSIALFLSAGCLATSQHENKVTEFSDLGKEGVKIAICDPGHCPAGRYANMVISNVEAVDSDMGEAIRNNIATNDVDVRAVLDKVMTKDVEAGFVYITDAYLEMDYIKVIDIPLDYSPLPQYGISVVEGSENREAAELFVRFITSKEGQRVIKGYGFLPAIEDPLPFIERDVHPDGILTVYAAASLTEAFSEISSMFENLTGIKTEIGFGSSGILRARLEGGAPADVYATASLKHAEILIEGGFIGEYEIFLRNRLIVATPG